ncbi:hypothetical protein A0J61_10056 [Choanephora cucurbitarum]|uniref:Uncharacterized protein n=1 Tax=Choanephora cucurbitarum TaxID=101091 RepID=A0A1C7MYI1_9FUNG|nr:hypothetical protein A0J61_10056 [Choanephora cucurbitarum]
MLSFIASPVSGCTYSHQPEEDCAGVYVSNHEIRSKLVRIDYEPFCKPICTDDDQPNAIKKKNNHSFSMTL